MLIRLPTSMVGGEGVAPTQALANGFTARPSPLEE